MANPAYAPAFLVSSCRGILSWAAQAPLRFSGLVVLAYVLTLTPTLRRHHFDLSTFIVAGDKYVDAAQTPAPIIVRPHSAGYDGQFYYKIALDPFAPASVRNGVTFDHPAWRLQRILYPITAFAIAAGQAPLVPAALFAVNAISLFVLAWLVSQSLLTGRASSTPFPMTLLWPGFLTTLTHDTTELLACALLLNAVMAYLNERFILFGVTAALAALTRETSSLMLAGIASVALIRAVRGRDKQDLPGAPLAVQRVNILPFLCAIAALVPFGAWHAWLALHVHDAAQTAALHANIGLPFAGVAHRLLASLTTAIAAPGVAFKARLMALYTAATAIFIVVFSISIVRALFGISREVEGGAPVAAGYACMLGLISLLSASGPWIDPTAIFRAFSECWVVGCLILTLSQPAPRPWTGLALVPLMVMNWSVCMTQLR